MAPHSSTLAWKIPWTEGPGGLQSTGLLRVRHDWVTSLSLFTFMHWRRKWQPTPVFLPGESQGRGAWWAAVYGVTQCRTRLKWLSSSSSPCLKGPFIYLFIYLIFLIWLCCTACGILVPQPGIQPTSPALELWTLKHWTTREVPLDIYLYRCQPSQWMPCVSTGQKLMGICAWLFSCKQRIYCTE